MDAFFLALIIVGAAGVSLGYKIGWNRAIELYRVRQIDQANKRAQDDRL